jgi:predicted HicB family RNase H-like nuclease
MKAEDKSNAISFPLRLPQSLKTAAKLFAERSGISLNRFISLAVQEKIERLLQERERARNRSSG